MKILSKEPLCFVVTSEEIKSNNGKLSPNSYLRIKRKGVGKGHLMETIQYLEYLKKLNKEV